MNYRRIALGLVLFFSSSIIIHLLGYLDVSIFVGEIDYAPDFFSKILDTLAGSLIIWGILDASPRGTPKGARKSRRN